MGISGRGARGPVVGCGCCLAFPEGDAEDRRHLMTVGCAASPAEQGCGVRPRGIRGFAARKDLGVVMLAATTVTGNDRGGVG